MQQNVKLNFHGIIGVALIILMFGIAYAWNWSVNWVYFVAAIVLYTIAIISLTTRQASWEYSNALGHLEISRLLFSCHCALMFLVIGLWLHFPGDGANLIFFIVGIAVGLTIPFSLFTLETQTLVDAMGRTLTPVGGANVARASGKFNPYGILGGVAIILMFGSAFFWRWNINWGYFLAATVFYSLAVIPITGQYENTGQYESSKHLTAFRLLLGCHLVLFILAVGLLLHFQDNRANLSFFVAGTAAGVAFPFLLIKG